MRRFSLITEADARRLEPGSTVVLEPGGHVTPLARDTLRDLRITVVDGRVPDDAAALVPAAEVKAVAVGSDHAGLALKDALVRALRGRGLSVHDVGTFTKDPVDYPDIASTVALAVARGEVQAGIVVDGAGLGSAIVANKIPGVRAAMCPTPTIARYAREHNGANVLTLGASLVSAFEARAIVEVWLSTPMTEPRYIARLAKIRQVEDRAKSDWP